MNNMKKNQMFTKLLLEQLAIIDYEYLLENREDFLLKTYGSRLGDNPKELIDLILSYDPTKSKKYSHGWLLYI